jgi:hypothetical protein
MFGQLCGPADAACGTQHAPCTVQRACHGNLHTYSTPYLPLGRLRARASSPRRAATASCGGSTRRTARSCPRSTTRLSRWAAAGPSERSHNAPATNCLRYLTWTTCNRTDRRPQRAVGLLRVADAAALHRAARRGAAAGRTGTVRDWTAAVDVTHCCRAAQRSMRSATDAHKHNTAVR